MVDLVALERLAKDEYADIVMDAYRVDAKLRVLLTDNSTWTFGGQRSSKADLPIIGTVSMWMAPSIDTTILRIANGSMSRPSHSIITGSAKMWSVQASFQQRRMRLCERF